MSISRRKTLGVNVILRELSIVKIQSFENILRMYVDEFEELYLESVVFQSTGCSPHRSENY